MWAVIVGIATAVGAMIWEGCSSATDTNASKPVSDPNREKYEKQCAKVKEETSGACRFSYGRDGDELKSLIQSNECQFTCPVVFTTTINGVTTEKTCDEIWQTDPQNKEHSLKDVVCPEG